jgi:antitoxin component of RelBE/YafQ-DinJ toxin-antitoxin module
MSTAINIFLRQVVYKEAIPFKISTRRYSDDITLASEKTLAKEWLLPEEDEAWANL